MPNEVIARVTRHIPAPPERVYAAWLDLVQIGAWMFGPTIRDEIVERLENAPRVGGSFSYVVRRQGQEFDHIGEYLALAPPRYISFTWGVRQEVTDFSRVTIAIAPTDSGSDLTLTHSMRPQWADFVPQAEAAWATMLASLARYLNAASETIA